MTIVIKEKAYYIYYSKGEKKRFKSFKIPLFCEINYNDCYVAKSIIGFEHTLDPWRCTGL